MASNPNILNFSDVLTLQWDGGHAQLSVSGTSSQILLPGAPPLGCASVQVNINRWFHMFDAPVVNRLLPAAPETVLTCVEDINSVALSLTHSETWSQICTSLELIPDFSPPVLGQVKNTISGWIHNTTSGWRIMAAEFKIDVFIDLPIQDYFNTMDARMRVWLQRRDEAMLHRLQVHVYAGDEEDICSICLSEIRNDGALAARLPCNHVFHRNCILYWIEGMKNCPICRTQLPSQ